MYAQNENVKSQRVTTGQIEQCVDRDMPEVTRALNGLREAIQRYDSLTARLADRLCSVTVPSSPACAGEPKSPQYNTVLASDINECRCHLRDITDTLESIYSRIEL